MPKNNYIRDNSSVATSSRVQWRVCFDAWSWRFGYEGRLLAFVQTVHNISLKRIGLLIFLSTGSNGGLHWGFAWILSVTVLIRRNRAWPTTTPPVLQFSIILTARSMLRDVITTFDTESSKTCISETGSVTSSHLYITPVGLIDTAYFQPCRSLICLSALCKISRWN
jgi:hypothetical protein